MKQILQVRCRSVHLSISPRGVVLFILAACLSHTHCAPCVYLNYQTTLAQESPENRQKSREYAPMRFFAFSWCLRVCSLNTGGWESLS